jgi:OOP family OmpA-OmpF porin
MKRFLVASALILVPFCANAQVVSGPYVSLGAGASIPGNEVEKATTSPGFAQELLDLDTGPTIQGSIGWGFGDGFRAEIEGNYINNHLSTASLRDDPGASSSISGEQAQFGFMANVFYDFNLGLPIVPYIGAGLGYQAVDINNYYGCHGVTTQSTCDATTGGLAYQAIGGIALPLDFLTPGLSLTAEYRYLGVNDKKSYDVGSDAGYAAYAANVGPKPQGKIKSVVNNEALIGVRYSFGDFLSQ